MTHIESENDINWQAIYTRMESQQTRDLEVRIRKLESKVPRNKVSINEIDPLEDLKSVTAKRSR